MSRPATDPDAGFTLLEVLISIAVISTTMVPLTSFFVTSLRLTHSQGLTQVAVQLALDGTERARGMRGPALLAGRAKCGASCPDPATTGASAYLSDTERWDAAAADGSSASLPRPGDAAQATTMDGITYRRYWYVGKCWQAAGGGVCGLDSTNAVMLYRVVVAVTWTGQECAQRVCSHVTSALFSSNPVDPVFHP